MPGYPFGGRNIAEVLAMSVTGQGSSSVPETHTNTAACAILDRLADVGLGYVSLGQPLTTLSGGERRRLKLATHMSEKGGEGTPADLIADRSTLTGKHLAAYVGA